MLPQLDIRHLYSVVVLAEELNFTRAAHILRVSQPALSKLITEIEERNRMRLFVREKGRLIDLTDAGRVFVEEARKALFHAERAVHLGRAAHEGWEDVLMIGYSHDADRAWISELLAIRLPLYPKLRVRTATRPATELVRSVMAGELNIALVTAPPKYNQITAVAFSESPLYVALPEKHKAAPKDRVVLKDLAHDEWILLAENVHPVIHDAIFQSAACEGIHPRNAHDIMTAYEAVHLVSERAGVAIFTKPGGLRFHETNIVIKPLSNAALRFETCLIIRSDDRSRVTNEFARAFLRRVVPKRSPAIQMQLPLSQTA
ncbi:MAG TPA: LysR substrate-binding domain-containing protein [Terriglobales bacterium]|nr:LysR substrate-binding domain-containing protein [Terriglobales bacterium]